MEKRGKGFCFPHTRDKAVHGCVRACLCAACAHEYVCSLMCVHGRCVHALDACVHLCVSVCTDRIMRSLSTDTRLIYWWSSGHSFLTAPLLRN